ncbi:MAG TPA: hypothetical protein VN458_08710 [Solirubrobacterales bacterium]|nr:hypothetical protein [Solirubrobacterales bacterium]
MRTRRRTALLLCSAAALGVGFFAFTGSAAAAPPVVPTCAFPATAGSDSCASLRTTGVAAPIGSTLEPIKLGVRVRSQFSPANSETTSVKLQFDENIALNLSGIPSCPAAELVNKNVAQAWEQCGPGADGNPPSEGNAYLSTGLGSGTAAQVSGIGSTIPNGGGAVACTMVFKGADNTHVTIYARAPANTSGCDNPATNTGGTTTVLFTGALTHQPASSIFDWTLTIANTQTADPALDDFYATLARGTAFRAKCVTRSPSAHRMQGTWDYTATGDANDNFTAVHACPH